MAIKTCPICGTIFETNTRQKYCSIECKKEQHRREGLGYYRNHKEERKEYRNKNKDRINRKRREKYKEDEVYRSKVTKYNIKYYDEHRSKRVQDMKNYQQTHKLEISERKKVYYQAQDKRELNRKERNRYLKRKEDNTYQCKLICRSLVRRCISKKNVRTQELLGYSADELVKHIECQFYNGMSWNNRDQWEVHHIIPLGEFNFINEDGSSNYDMVKRANSLDNLMPLFKEDHKIITNIYKSEKKYLTREEICDILKIVREERLKEWKNNQNQ